MSASAKFEFIFTGNSAGLKQAAGEAKTELAGVRQEAARTVPAFDAQAEASERAATAARDLASASVTGMGAAQRNIAALGSAADTSAMKMERMVNAFAGITAPAANRNGRAEDIAAYGRELDRLRASLDPLFAAQSRYQAKLEEINRAERVGAISASSAIDFRIRERNAYDSLTDSIDRANRARKAAAEGAVARRTVTPERGADITAFLDQRDQTRARFDPVFAVLSQYKKSIEEIREANRVGILTEDQMADAISRRRKAALAAVAVARGRDGSGVDREGQFRRQNLMYQGMDIGQGLFGGMPIGMIAAQQLPQIAQNYVGQGGGMSGFLKDVQTMASGATRAITPLTVSIAGLAASVAAGALAYNGYLTSTKEVETAAAGLGRATAGTAAAMEASAQAGAAAAGISVKASRSMEAQFLRTGRIGSENFEALIGLSKDFGATIGVDAASAGTMLAEMFSDPAKAAQTLYQQYGLIDAATARRVTNLASQNRQSEAQAVLLKALPDQLASAEEATTKLGRAWQNVSNFASNAFDTIGSGINRMVDGPSLDEQIAQAQATRDRMVSSFGGGVFSLLSPGGIQQAAQAAQLEQLQSDKEIRDYEVAREKRERERIQRSQAATRASAGSGANASAIRRQTLENDIAAIQNGRAGLTGEDAKQADAALEAKQRVLEALNTRQQRSLELDRLDIQIQNERNPLLRAELEARRARLQLADQEVGADEISTAAAKARNRVIEETVGSAQRQAQDMQEELEVRTRLNALVASGSITSEDANRLLQEELTLRPLIAAAATAEGEAKERLNKVIEDLRTGYAGIAAAQKEASGQDYLRSQNEKLEQLRVEQALIGANNSTRARATALLQAEQTIRQRGIDTNSALAKQIRENASATAELNSQIERQAEAWSNVQRAAEGAIDGAVDKLSDGDFKGALDEVKDSLLGFVKDDIKANLKNGLLGTDYGTSADVGGLTGIVSRLFGGGNKADPASIVSKAMGQSVASMSVNAGTVMINGGVAGGLGGLLPGANDNSNILQFPGGGSMSAYARAIRSIESDGSGGYGALGPITASGDRAYGAYQIMGANIPSWTKSALGQSLSPQEFLGNQSAQDAVFQKIFGGYVGKYGVSGAAQAWFGGEGSVGRGGAADMLGTTGTAYVEKFTKALGTATQSTDVAAQGLGNLGNGFNQFGSTLSQLEPSGGGGGGGLFGWIGSLFGFSQSKTSTGFSLGGYTGPGGVDEPRGVVHAGEVVWSQRDVARVGGVAAAEAMRLGRRGYATGGAAASIPYPIAANTNSGKHAETQRPKIEIHDYAGVKVEAEETTDERGGRTTRFVISEKVAEALSMPGGAAKRTMNKQFGVQQRRPRR